jgi:hypothetical protein
MDPKTNLYDSRLGGRWRGVLWCSQTSSVWTRHGTSTLDRFGTHVSPLSHLRRSRAHALIAAQSNDSALVKTAPEATQAHHRVRRRICRTWTSGGSLKTRKRIVFVYKISMYRIYMVAIHTSSLSPSHPKSSSQSPSPKPSQSHSHRTSPTALSTHPRSSPANERRQIRRRRAPPGPFEPSRALPLHL